MGWGEGGVRKRMWGGGRWDEVGRGGERGMIASLAAERKKKAHQRRRPGYLEFWQGIPRSLKFGVWIGLEGSRWRDVVLACCGVGVHRDNTYAVQLMTVK